MLENPTRGLDVESAAWVWELLGQYSKNGAAVVFSSSELDEIFMAADRVLVFFEGRIVLDVPTAQTDIMQLGAAIAGNK